MTDSHEVVIRLGRPFDIQTATELDARGMRTGGAFLPGVREITIPFDNQAAAEAALGEITLSVRRVHDAGGEDYRLVVAGEVVPDEYDRAIAEHTARMRASILAPKPDLGNGRRDLAGDMRDLAEIESRHLGRPA